MHGNAFVVVVFPQPQRLDLRLKQARDDVVLEIRDLAPNTNHFRCAVSKERVLRAIERARSAQFLEHFAKCVAARPLQRCERDGGVWIHFGQTAGAKQLLQNLAIVSQILRLEPEPNELVEHRVLRLRHTRRQNELFGRLGDRVNAELLERLPCGLQPALSVGERRLRGIRVLRGSAVLVNSDVAHKQRHPFVERHFGLRGIATAQRDVHHVGVRRCVGAQFLLQIVRRFARRDEFKLDGRFRRQNLLQRAPAHAGLAADRVADGACLDFTRVTIARAAEVILLLLAVDRQLVRTRNEGRAERKLAEVHRVGVALRIEIESQLARDRVGDRVRAKDLEIRFVGALARVADDFSTRVAQRDLALHVKLRLDVARGDISAEQAEQDHGHHEPLEATDRGKVSLVGGRHRGRRRWRSPLLNLSLGYGRQRCRTRNGSQARPGRKCVERSCHVAVGRTDVLRRHYTRRLRKVRMPKHPALWENRLFVAAQSAKPGPAERPEP